VATGTATLAEQWTEYRKAMLDYAGIVVFIFGNKRGPSGDIVLSNGMKEEFDLCVQRGAHPLPIGATGFMAHELWKAMAANLSEFYPGATPDFVTDFQRLGDASKSLDDFRATIQRLIEHLQKA
jgi:hypothetical protein